MGLKKSGQRCICCQGKGKSHSPDRVGNSLTQVSEEQFQDQLPIQMDDAGCRETQSQYQDLCLLAHLLLLAWVKTLLEEMRLRYQPCQISSIM